MFSSGGSFIASPRAYPKVRQDDVLRYTRKRRELPMTELLRHALAEIEKLPADTQNAVATRILDDLADDQAWEARFKATSAEQWNRLTVMARQEIAAGDTVPLEHVFPAKVTEE
jgi:hypothetical protein